jgi:hypothetical protein
VVSSQRASYQLSAAQRAALREAAELRQLRRQWQTAQLERSRQRRRAGQLRERYQVRPPKVGLLAAAESGTSEALARELAAATAETVSLRAELDHLEHEGRRQVIRTMVASIIGDAPGAPPGQTSEPVAGPTTTRHTETARERAIDEAERVVSRLDVNLDQAPRVRQLLETIATTTEDRCGPLLRALRTEVSKFTDAAERRRSEAAVLASVRAVAEQTGDRSMDTLLSTMQVDFDAGQAIDVGWLERAAEAALHGEEQERERGYVLRTVIEAFEEIHYEVLPGVEVSTPSEGVLVRRDNGVPRAVHVQIDSGVISVSPVQLTSTTTGTTGRAGAINPETERLLCEDTDEVWQRVERTGVGVAVLRLNSADPHVVEVPAETLAATPDKRKRPVPKAAERSLP